jgi:hypothetical protein
MKTVASYELGEQNKGHVALVLITFGYTTLCCEDGADAGDVNGGGGGGGGSGGGNNDDIDSVVDNHLKALTSDSEGDSKTAVLSCSDDYVCQGDSKTVVISCSG